MITSTKSGNKTKASKIEKLLLEERGYISQWPKNKAAVMIISGGLDSIATSARLIEEFGIELFPLHIQRGQTNRIAEEKSVAYFTRYFQKRYGENKFHTPKTIYVNVPPVEIKKDLIPYMKKKGYPMRDPIMHLLGVQYAVAASEEYGKKIKSVYCAIVPEDYFPHSSLDGLRSTTLAICKNMGDKEWNITSPNIDPYLIKNLQNKSNEIKWSMEKGIPIGKTISCNDASKGTDYLACGNCLSCSRRSAAFKNAGVDDPTEYYYAK